MKIGSCRCHSQSAACDYEREAISRTSFRDPVTVPELSGRRLGATIVVPVKHKPSRAGSERSGWHTAGDSGSAEESASRSLRNSNASGPIGMLCHLASKRAYAAVKHRSTLKEIAQLKIVGVMRTISLGNVKGPPTFFE